MVWNAPHLHLMINHLPVFAPVLAIPLLLLALWKRDEKGAFVGAVLLLIFAAIGAFISTETGEKASDAIEGEPGVSMRAMAAHEERAESAAIVLYVIAAVAVIAVVLRFRSNVPSSLLWVGILLVLSLVASGVVGWVALKGGEIRHPEIRPVESGIEPTIQP